MSKSVPSPDELLQVGDEVMGLYSGKWYPGVLARILYKGTVTRIPYYVVDWDEENTHSTMKWCDVKLRAPKPKPKEAKKAEKKQGTKSRSVLDMKPTSDRKPAPQKKKTNSVINLVDDDDSSRSRGGNSPPQTRPRAAPAR
eukprot:Hpha_TRINITY_DN15166_c3_g2::TRINITY_DN15166_c3_g2_i1::g.130052::m.130052